ncbi:MAG: hypothetical protein NZ838_14400, partial [Candidatus Marinimicrobia bacterium]|nr:hypothetical protein [Candidatus Neomarinimicrobiota bacterium]
MEKLFFNFAQSDNFIIWFFDQLVRIPRNTFNFLLILKMGLCPSVSTAIIVPVGFNTRNRSGTAF